MNTTTLREVTNSKYNNLNFIRFVAAIMVIISHAIPICEGMNREDIIGTLTDGKLNLGGIAVGVFFVTGGYLIAQSSERKQKAIPFFRARIKRIFPSLVLMVCVCAFVMGPILTNLSWNEYFSNMETYKYLLNMLLIPTHSLPGVFVDNIYPQVVNGPLWTLPVEFACYVGCFVAYKLGFFQLKRFKFTIPVVLIGGVMFFEIFEEQIVLMRIVRPVLLYYIGIGYYVFKDRIRLDARYGLIASVLFVLSIVLNVCNIGMLFCFPYMIYFIAYGIRGKLCEFGKTYEISYGMYLWAWPVQQILVSEFEFVNTWYENALFTVIIVILIGVLNNVLIEQNRWIKR